MLWDFASAALLSAAGIGSAESCSSTNTYEAVFFGLNFDETGRIAMERVGELLTTSADSIKDQKESKIRSVSSLLSFLHMRR
jgi:hypothetical protein